MVKPTVVIVPVRIAVCSKNWSSSAFSETRVTRFNRTRQIVSMTDNKFLSCNGGYVQARSDNKYLPQVASDLAHTKSKQIHERRVALLIYLIEHFTNVANYVITTNKSMTRSGYSRLERCEYVLFWCTCILATVTTSERNSLAKRFARWDV